MQYRRQIFLSLKNAALPALFLLCILAPAAFAAQPDSVATPLTGVRWVLSLDSRSTIIEKKHISINGVLTGLRFGERGHKITVGYYWLNYGSKQKLIDLHKSFSQAINLSYYTRTDVRFVSFAYWYPLYRDKRWIVSIPAEVGIGQESARYRQLLDDGYLGRKGFYFGPLQLGVYGEFKFSPWVGVGMQLGYRDAIYRGPLRAHFRGPYYSYGLTFYPGKIYSDVRKILKR